MDYTAEYWVKHLKMEEHPEGGYFAETYRSDGKIGHSALPEHFGSDRHYCTAIYFLLRSGQVSKLHKLNSDEMWHFYEGCPLKLITINNDGVLAEFTLGRNSMNGEVFQVLVPAGSWFGACPLELNSYTLVGCTVAPGFEYSDFRIGSRKDLISEYPQHREIITKFTDYDVISI